MKKTLFLCGLVLMFQNSFGLPCQGGFLAQQSTSTALSVDFTSTVISVNSYQGSYLYVFGDGDSATVADPTHTYAQPGTYYVTQYYTDFGCTDTIQDSVTVLPGTASSSYTYFDAMVWSSYGVGFSNHPVWINVYRNSGQQVISLMGTTGNSGFGRFRDSLPTTVNFDSVKFFTYDCNGNLKNGSWTSLYNGGGYYTDSIFPSCPITGPLCQANFSTKLSTTLARTVEFTATTLGSGIATAGRVRHSYFFGDGDSAINVQNPTHTYPAPGKYEVTYIYFEEDTLNGNPLCSDVRKDSVEVYSIPAPTHHSFNVMVWSAPGVGVANYPVWINVYSNGQVTTKAGHTDSSGYGFFHDTLPVTTVFDSVRFFTYDCNGQMVTGVAGTSMFNSHPLNTMYDDTLYPSCNLSQPLCQPGFTHQQSASTVLTIDFTDTTSGSGIANGRVITRKYLFGDNDSVMGVKNPSHSYAQPGKYEVTYVYAEEDSVNTNIICTEVFKDSVEVLATYSQCNASYYVDTVNSGNGVAIIYNNSMPAHNDSNYTISYLWDFGDGDTSSAAFPTHTYASAGSYAVCLSITVDSAGSLCTSTFCDTLGVDSTGNLIYKNSSSFVLKVLDPATIGIKENRMENFKVYPNPVSDRLTVEASAQLTESVSWVMVDLNGRAVMQGQWKDANAGEKLQMELSALPAGIYILKLNIDRASGEHFRILKQ